MHPTIFDNLEFFALLIPAFFFIWISKRVHATLFKFSILAASVFFVSTLPNIKIGYLIFLGLFMGLVFLTAQTFIRFRVQKIKSLTIVLSILVLIFSMIKFKTWSQWVFVVFHHDHSPFVSLLPAMGFGFLAIKCYGLLVDIYSQRIKSVSLFDFLIYCFYFPMFLAGPIEKYSHFSSELNRASQDRYDYQRLNLDLPRFIIGAFKVNVLAACLQAYAIPFLTERQFSEMDSLLLYSSIVSYYGYEYMNFSGYSDMAISTSKMMGIQLSENFDHPFMAQSLTELWRRWHITLANWLRDYIYYPLVFNLTRLFSNPSKKNIAWISAFSIFITFAICGLWHGDQWGMILFGILSGLVLGLETILIHLYSKRFKVWKENHLLGRETITLCQCVLTFHVACLTFAPVLLSNEQLKMTLKLISPLILSVIR